jgi:hypothetical protein
MLSATTTHQVTELRELLARGALHNLSRITIGDTVNTDAELAVRVFLANLDRLGQTDGASPAQWGRIEEHIQRAHQAITVVLER